MEKQHSFLSPDLGLLQDPAPFADPVESNVFLIDWLTFVAHGDDVESLKRMMGFGDDIPWETKEKFRNGYPLQSYWNGITFSWGADEERFYKDPKKARKDMGVCVNLSGTGCRAFESYGHGDWMKVFTYLFRDTSDLASTRHIIQSYNITRLDLAYDDHLGILNMQQLERDTRDRNYRSRAKYAEITWSDNQRDDIQGMTIQIGSDKSDIKIRIYDKAAERGFKDRHWIRCEMQLRDGRALEACNQLLKEKHIGLVATGVLRNYLCYVEPSADANKSRWPIAPYWENMLLNMDKIRLWLAPGEPYNFSKTEYWMLKQYGQAMVVLDQLVDDAGYLLEKAKELYPIDDLAPKYKAFLVKAKENDLYYDKPPKEPPKFGYQLPYNVQTPWDDD